LYVDIFDIPHIYYASIRDFFLYNHLQDNTLSKISYKYVYNYVSLHYYKVYHYAVYYLLILCPGLLHNKTISIVAISLVLLLHIT